MTDSKVRLVGVDRIKIMGRQRCDNPDIWQLVVSNVKGSSRDLDVIKSTHHDSEVKPCAVESPGVLNWIGISLTPAWSPKLWLNVSTYRT